MCRYVHLYFHFVIINIEGIPFNVYVISKASFHQSTCKIYKHITSQFSFSLFSRFHEKQNTSEVQQKKVFAAVNKKIFLNSVKNFYFRVCVSKCNYWMGLFYITTNRSYTQFSFIFFNISIKSKRKQHFMWHIILFDI